MLATDDNSDEDDVGHDTENSVAPKYRSISGDDLGDSFAPEEQPRLKKGWVDEILEREAAANSSDEGDDFSEESEGAEEDDEAGSSDDNSEEDSKRYSMKDWEQSVDEQFDPNGDGSEEDLSENVKHQTVEKKSVSEMRKRDEAVSERMKSQEQTRPSSTQAKSLPYLIDAPKSLDELNVLLENRSNSEIVILIDRIRVSNAVAVVVENRKKMQVQCSCLPFSII